MARDPPLPIHPHDRALLKPLSALGKHSSAGGVSFLRRTEYISADQGQKRFESSTSKDLLRVRNDPKRKRKPNLDKEHPLNILRHVIKGFDVAYPRDAFTGEDSHQNVRGADITEADTKAWARPKHPTKPELELLDSYPLLPDLDAIPGTNSYIVTKFSTNPLDGSDPSDRRLDVAILRPQNGDEDRLEDKMDEYRKDLSLAKPTAEFDYEFYLANDARAVKGIKRKFNVNNPNKDDQELYNYEDAEGNRAFLFNRIRAYETYQQQGDGDNAFGDTVAIALHDPDSKVGSAEGARKRLKKGAYFYPVIQRTNLRPKRKAAASQMQDEEIIDALQVTIRDADETELGNRLVARAKLDTTIEVPTAADASQEVEAEA